MSFFSVASVSIAPRIKRKNTKKNYFLGSVSQPFLVHSKIGSHSIFCLDQPLKKFHFVTFWDPLSFNFVILEHKGFLQLFLMFKYCNVLIFIVEYYSVVILHHGFCCGVFNVMWGLIFWLNFTGKIQWLRYCFMGLYMWQSLKWIGCVVEVVGISWARYNFEIKFSLGNWCGKVLRSTRDLSTTKWILVCYTNKSLSVHGWYNKNSPTHKHKQVVRANPRCLSQN